jgi:hypothetical protein
MIFTVKHDDIVCSKCINERTNELTSDAEQFLRVFLKSSAMKALKP